MTSCFAVSSDNNIPIEILMTTQFDQWLAQQTSIMKNWISANNFKANSGQCCLCSDDNGKLNRVLLGITDPLDIFQVGSLPMRLAKGVYTLAGNLTDNDLELATIAWGLGSYQFSQYKKQSLIEAQLAIDSSLDIAHIENTISAIYLVRDLVNTPVEDMGPAELSDAASKIADQFGAQFTEIIGDELLTQGYPCVHAVGRGASENPRFIDIKWGNENHPKVTLVGKGVCFDTGGHDLKPAAGMLLMRKDMAGGAHVLGLARMIMASSLPVRLRVLIPAVVNAISADAYRPGDILSSRKGLTIEVTNTDAEGRLVLCDALAEACKEKPDLLIDIATLTGAARLAVGTDLSAVFTDDDELMVHLELSAESEMDPVWRLPLYRPYRKLLDSRFADISNASLSPVSPGATTAALFLREFVDPDIAWLHFDIMAWNLFASPGKPEGGEANGIRALYQLIKQRFSR